MYYDSSDDEDNRTTNPYEGVPVATSSQMISNLTSKKLKKIRTVKSILGRDPKENQTHQYLLHNPAVAGRKKAGATNKSPSEFPKALQEVKKVLDALPSSPQRQSALPNTIVPSFRGILWQSDINPLELFFSTRVQWVGEHNYSSKEVFSSFDTLVEKLPLTQAGVAQFKQHYGELKLTKNELESGIPYLSEGQIPRHALLYSFGVKAYSTGEPVPAEPLYGDDCKPKANKAYLGKMLVSQNPHTLFQTEDKAVYIPGFDKAHGGGVIAKHIVGELEIQSRAANLQGIIKKDINTKLPKFHHQEVPERYQTKYGLDKELYEEFKSTFDFLKNANEYGKLSWIYLESVLLAHLIQFHEIQLYKYSNKMAQEIGKEIFWVDRNDAEINEPFQP